MNLQEKVGQMLVMGWQGSTAEESQSVSAHALTTLEEWHAGGVVYLGRNVADPAQVARLNNDLQSHSRIPLLIPVDQEGGWVVRVREPATIFPGNMALGATWSPKLAYRCARAIGREVAAMGFNVDLAPCLDVNSNPENPIIGVRSYGESPVMVGVMGTQAIKGLRDAGVLSCAKHFPGHGDTSLDSHKLLPVISGDRDRLDTVELRPFRTAIEFGVDMIMTSHIIFADMDPELPATLSRKILTGLLRKEMGFEGLIITDCLEMRAIAQNYTPEETGVLAIKAGADLLLISHTLECQRRMRNGILAAIESGEISESRIDESVERILNMKRARGLFDRKPVDPAAVLDVVGCQEHRDLEKEIARKALTLVRDRDGLIPLALGSEEPIFVFGLHKATAALSEEIGLRSKVMGAEKLNGSHPNALCVVVTSPGVDCRPLVEQAFKASNRVILVGVEEPYEAGIFPEAGTFVASYGFQPCSLDAIAALLFGETTAKGRLPVHIPDRSGEAWTRAESNRLQAPE